MLGHLHSMFPNKFSKAQLNMWGSLEVGEDERRHPPVCAGLSGAQRQHPHFYQMPGYSLQLLATACVFSTLGRQGASKTSSTQGA